MHFHMPKLPHSVREFLGEVGIIVVGVTIALAAEQAIEALHWRHVVDSERESLDRGVQDGRHAMLERVAQQACADRRLSELALVFDRHDRHEPLGLVGPIGRVSVWTGSTVALRIATADGSLSHMSVEEKTKYFDAFETYEQSFSPAAQEERESWRTLQRLDHAEALNDEDWRDLRKAYNDAVDSNMVMKSNLANKSSGQWLSPFNLFPQQSLPVDMQMVPNVKKLCARAVAS
jgi:hypothetical protein